MAHICKRLITHLAFLFVYGCECVRDRLLTIFVGISTVTGRMIIKSLAIQIILTHTNDSGSGNFLLLSHAIGSKWDGESYHGNCVVTSFMNHIAILARFFFIFPMYFLHWVDFKEFNEWCLSSRRIPPPPLSTGKQPPIMSFEAVAKWSIFLVWVKVYSTIGKSVQKITVSIFCKSK